MTDELVEEITREVLARLVKARNQSSTASKSISRSTGEKALIVLTGGSERLEEVFRQLGLIADKSTSLTVVMSRSAEKIIGVHQVRRIAYNAEVITGFCEDPHGVLDNVDVVYVPILTLNTASRVAQLQTDNIAGIMIVFAILRGIPVIAATDSIYCCQVAEHPERIPPAAQQKIDSMLQILREYGVQLVPIDQLTASSLSSTIGAQASSSVSSSLALSRASSLPRPITCEKEDCDGCGKCVERKPDAVGTIVNSGASRIGASPGVNVADPGIAGMIDHTLLKADATEGQIRKLCEEAKRLNFASVCINPTNVALASRLLQGTPVKVCTVIGFPLGAATSTVKAMEARDAIANGATEIDMVVNVGALKSGNDQLVEEDIRAVVNAAKGRAIVKVILEMALLTREEKIRGCEITKSAGADFVKTSTGFGPGGATAEDIALMRQTVGPTMGIKAAGGIRTAEDAEKMVAAGATRIGASASVAIVQGKAAASA